jgi:cell wall-associated NlpC family hydrolase
MATNGAVAAIYENGASEPVSGVAATRVRSSLAETVLPSATGYVIYTEGLPPKRIDLPYEPVSVERISDDGEVSYYLATDSYENTSGTVTYSSYVYQFGADGTLAATFTMWPSALSSSSRRIQIDAGKVYQLRTAGAEAQVLRLFPDTPGGFVKAEDVGTADSVVVSSAAASVPKVSLLQVQLATDELANRRWTYKKSTNGNKKQLGKSASKVRQPRYLASIESSAKVKGIPYAWGAMDAPSTLVAGSGSFDAKAKKGKYTGNTSSAAGGHVANTIGVDCSGLISIAFFLPKIKSDSLIASKYFISVKAKDRQPGDIIQHPGHVVIYLGSGGSGKYLIAEATNTSAANDRAVIVKRPSSDFSGWNWGRYANFDPRGLDD